MAVEITWLNSDEPSGRQGRTRFLSSVHDLVKKFPEQCVATAIPFGTNGELTMLHIVAGSKDGELTQFSDSLVRQFETLAARFIAGLSQSELEAAHRALEAREIGALSGASSEELAVVVGRQNVGRAQKQIAALFRSHSD
ncbi:MAG: hypothetical protein QOJ05_1022 [Verrucomicrobiota bacterium]|jgi:hypothetical protein